jgi:serine protease Do
MKGARRWVGASALALAVAVPGILGYGALNQAALAQSEATITKAAQVTVPSGIRNELPSFADLVEAVKPAVVSITVEGSQPVTNSQMGDDYYFNFPDLPPDNPLRRFFDQFGPEGQGRQGPDGQRPQARRFQAAGSGFIISADGYVVTNNHVVEDSTDITVLMDNGDEHSASLVGTDPRTDLALLKIEDDVADLPFVTFAEQAPRVGDWVVAVGNPFGLGGTVTAGIVSASGRDISGSQTGDFLQIDAAVNRGNSGGPAFDLSGNVVGVNSAIFSPTGGNVGIAFAIPASIVKQVVSDLKEDGRVTRGFLGVNIQDVTRDIADSVGLPTARGAVVTQTTEGAPAEKAGIRSGDIIVEVDGDAIDNALDLSRTIGGKDPGSAVAVTVWRNGAREELTVTLEKLDETQVAQQPEAPTPPQGIEGPVESSVGISLIPNADGDGIVIQDVDPDSIAANKGLAPGDVILETDNKVIATADDFEKAIAGVRDSGRSTALLKTSRNGNVRFVGLPLGNN